MDCSLLLCGLFFFNDTATTESYTYLHTLPLHDALPISSEVTRLFDPFPQLLRNVRFNGGAPLDDAAVQAAIRDGESRLGSGGRLVIRKSGTERVIRVMAEGEDETLVDQVVGAICQSIEHWSGARPTGCRPLQIGRAHV